jgi:hypothetical protein
VADYKLRNGETVCDVAKGPLGRVVVGVRIVDDKQVPSCWNMDGRWRWDDKDRPLDIMDFKSV